MSDQSIIDDLFDLWCEDAISRPEFLQVCQIFKTQTQKGTDEQVMFPKHLEPVAQQIYLRRNQQGGQQ